MSDVEEEWPLPVAPPKKVEPAKSKQLVTIGDRLFRAGNTRRAEERYEQAVRAKDGAQTVGIQDDAAGMSRATSSEADSIEGLMRTRKRNRNFIGRRRWNTTVRCYRAMAAALK